MTQVGVCVEGNSRVAGRLGFFHPDLPEFFFGQLPELQRDQRVVLAVSPEDGNSRCMRFENLQKTHQTSRPKGETTHAYLFDLLPDREPPAKNSEAGKFMLGCESSDQGQGTPLAEPANNDPVRGDTILDLLRDELIHFLPGLEHPGFVFWTLEPESENIKPERAS